MDCFVGHGGYIGAAGGTESHDGRYLGNAHLRYNRLVVKNPPPVVDIGEDL